MIRTFSRRIDPSLTPFKGVGACAPCAAANADIGLYGVGAMSDDTKRTAFRYGVGVSTLVGVIGFSISHPVVIGLGLVGLFGSMAGLAMTPREVVTA